MSDNSNIHAGHRKRLKERYILEGLDNFNEINVLELLLFYCVQRRDTNPLAHRLLDHFGSLPDVMEATPEELMEVDGISEHIATFLSLITSANRYYMVKKSAKVTTLDTMDACAEYLKPYFHGATREKLYLLCLDAKCKVICCKLISEGDVNAVAMSQRKIMEIVLQSKASSVVLAHNHPSGNCTPSEADCQMTGEMKRILRGLDVILVDHYIISGENCYSIFREMGEVR